MDECLATMYRSERSERSKRTERTVALWSFSELTTQARCDSWLCYMPDLCTSECLAFAILYVPLALEQSV